MEWINFSNYSFLDSVFSRLGFGRHIEQKHLRELDEKEKQFAHIRIDTNRFVETSAKGQLVSSNVVISHDYFKYVLANIQKFSRWSPDQL
jgi:hypothetical protein